MDDNGNGRSHRVADLYGSSGGRRRAVPVDLTPDEARALIDQVFRKHGLDPREATDKFGWRNLSIGSADGYVGVIEWEPGEHHLVVFAPILELDPAVEGLSVFYRTLLEINHHGTDAARFSLQDGVVFVSLSRPIRVSWPENAIHAGISRSVPITQKSYPF